MEKLTRLLSVCIIVALVFLGGLWIFENKFNVDDTQPIRGTTGEPQYMLDDNALGNKLQAILSENNDLDISISITDLQTGQRYHWGESASYTAASIGKLVTAMAYLRLVETGHASLDDTIGDVSARTQLSRLIKKSDNVAWQKLNDIVTHEGLAAYARSIGLTSYSSETNTLTSNDCALLLSKLASQKLLTADHTAYLLSLLKEADMRNFIVAAVPAGTDVYHKVGYLSDRLHDAAIIKQGDRSYVLVIFSKSSSAYNFSRGSAVCKSITGATLQAFFGNPT